MNKYGGLRFKNTKWGLNVTPPTTIIIHSAVERPATSETYWNGALSFKLKHHALFLSLLGNARKSNIPSLIGIKLLVGVDVLCELFKVSWTTHWRAIVMVKQPLVNSSCMISPNLKPNADSEIQEIFVCGIRNLEFWSLESVIQLKESGILLTVGIQNQSFINKWSQKQCLDGIWFHTVKSRIQDCLGSPYKGQMISVKFIMWGCFLVDKKMLQISL